MAELIGKASLDKDGLMPKEYIQDCLILKSSIDNVLNNTIKPGYYTFSPSDNKFYRDANLPFNGGLGSLIVFPQFRTINVIYIIQLMVVSLTETHVVLRFTSNNGKKWTNVFLQKESENESVTRQ